MSLRSDNGFTLIETVIGLAIMVVMIMAISELFLSNLSSVSQARARASAVALANRHMEYIKGLSYASVATQHGTVYPPGNIPENQDITSDGRVFVIKTSIAFVDDPYDGNAAGTIAGKPKDLAPADYKRVAVAVSLKSSGKEMARVTTDLSTESAETNNNTGVLAVSIIDSEGQAVAGASVTVVNNTTSPAVNISTSSDANGNVMIPNLPPDANNDYVVTAARPGYSTDSTSSEPSGSQYAVNPHPNIIAQQVTPVTLAIDRLASLTVLVKNESGAALAGKSITITGGKINLLNPTVYKFTDSQLSDSAGQISWPNIEWDSYSFTPPSGYYIVTSAPYSPHALAGGANDTVVLTITTDNKIPTIASVTPQSQSANTSGTVVITGTNLRSGSVIKLKRAGHSDITMTGVRSSSGSTKLTANLNLNGAATGVWDIFISNSRGTVTQSGGFNVSP